MQTEGYYGSGIEMRNMSSLLYRAVAACVLLLLAPALLGQGVSGRILGTVQDKSGAVVTKVVVTVTNQGTGSSVIGKSDSNGQYRVENLQPGNYQVKFVAQGFRPYVSNGNVVSVDASTLADASLEVGSASETIEVSAAPPLVDTTSSSLGDVISQKEISNLPLNGRIFSQLVQTVPGSIASGFGSAPESAAGAGAVTAISASVNGMPWGGTTYTLDGVNNMEMLNAFINVTPPLDSLQEVKVSTNNAEATVGTYGGAQVNAYIKSGSNSFHGSGYEFYRGDSLNAYQWRATTKAPYRANQFGGSLGGPIIRNKAFFFVDYQALLLQRGISYILTVPTDLMKQGTFLKSQFPTIYDPQTKQPFPTVTTSQGDAWQIPTARFDPVSAKMVAGANIWPTATNQASTSNNFNTNTVEPDNNHQFDIKGDYEFASGDRVFVRESYQRRDLSAPSPGTQFVQIGDVNAASRNHNTAIGYNHAFSQTAVNEFRVGFNRFNTHDFGNDIGTNENAALGIPNGNDPAFGATGIGNFQIGNIVNTGSQGWTNSHRISNSFQITDNFTKSLGRHTLTVGEDVRWISASLTNSDANKNGDFTFSKIYTSNCTQQPNCTLQPSGGNEFASFLLGMLSNQDRGYVATDPATRSTFIGVYGQDQYRVTNNLTLNLALRWDVITPAIDKLNHQSNFDLSKGVLNFATSGNRGPNVDTYYGGVSPRVGLAYTPNHGDTSIAGAFGITHFPGNFGAMGGFLERNYPYFEVFSSQAQFLNVPLPALSVAGLPTYIATSTSAPLQPPAAISPETMDRKMQADVANAWNFGIQQKLSNSTAVDVTYVGTKGSHLFRRWNINTPPPGTTAFNSRLPYQYFNSSGQQYATNIGYAAANGSSIYHGMQVQLRKKLTYGLDARVSYTWSKEIDNMNMWWPLDDRYNRAVGNSQAPDVPHNFVGSFTYQLPFGKGRHWMGSANGPAENLLGGWQISSITLLQAGQPLRIKTSTDVLGSGVTNSADVTCPSVRTFKSLTKWFDTSCFATPKALTLGNAKQGIVRGPGFYNSDFSLSKSVELHEGMRLNIQADAFNLANTPHYSNPDTTLGHSNFGVVGGTNGAPRQIQLGAHVTF